MPTDPTLVAALRDATVGQLVVDSEDMARMAKDVNQAEPGFVAVFPHDAKMFNRLAALALAVARMQEEAASVFCDSIPNDPVGRWEVGFAFSMKPPLHGPTLPAALAALLEAE